MENSDKQAKKIKKIAITGGKGGTGKSTVAVLLALSLVKKGKNVVLCDCDVECPNDYLLIGEKLKGKPAEKAFAEFPKLIKKKCRKCGLCADTCRSNAIFQPRDKKGKLDYPIFIKDLCSNCGACWTICPYGAIERRKEEVGRIYANKIKKAGQKGEFYLITGEAKPGLEEVGPVVIQTKRFALEFIEKIGLNQSKHQSKPTNRSDENEFYILFDTAAGTHCPVVSAMLDCDFAYCVTEPTPMGAYDLNLILELSEKLKIPAKVILNRSDLGNKKIIYSIVKKHKAKIEREIPYSDELAEAYSKGRLLAINN